MQVTDSQRQQQAILQFLRTGRHDPVHSEWPGSVIPRCIQADSEMRAALVAEVANRTKDLPAPKVAIPSDLQAFTHSKIEPMVRGLFPKAEQNAVLKMLDNSVVFLMPNTIQKALYRNGLWLGTAWDVANIYLASMGAESLSGDAKSIVGLSSDTSCFVSFEYFSETNRFADFVVHEIAHVFHNCRRESIGLSSTRTRKYLVRIAYNQTETFAYACEAYSRLLELGRTPAERLALGLDKGDTLIEMVVGNCIVLLPESQILADTARKAQAAIKHAGVTAAEIVAEADRLRDERLAKRYPKLK